jgi:membrane fusion protein (multidrug efflux system)
MKQNKFYQRALLTLLLGSAVTLGINSCSSSAANQPQGAPPAQSLPVLAVETKSVITYQEFTASLEGSRDIEIRPQVDGTLDQIYVDEGAHVRKGQPLFRINAGLYREQYNNASASLQSAKAAMESARINVEKLEPLVANNVISEVQLKTAKAAYDAAKANVAQAQAQASAAAINVGYTTISAPADGYIGMIPYKTGSLVGRTSPEALTVVSETKTMHVYFSFSENDFLRFKDLNSGATIEEKVKQLPEVELLLPDNSIYAFKGKVQLVQGQFDATSGSIQLRASFPNDKGLLRSGNTGRVRIPHQSDQSLIVPQEATFDLQDKTFVFAVQDSNKVMGKAIEIAGKSGTYYLVKGGLKPGDQIVYSGLGRLNDGAVIDPKKITLDSLLKVRPL